MRIALALGDAGGVGPELAAKLLAHDDMKALDVIVVGDARVLEMGARHAGVTLDLPRIGADQVGPDMAPGHVLLDLENCAVDGMTLGQSSAHAGAASLQNFGCVLQLAGAGIADAAMFTPFNKHSMRAGAAQLCRRDRLHRRGAERRSQRARVQRPGGGLERPA
ncbi:4-hydroxythreonine-4-phosphate dehydrogenase PdxA [Paracoccus sp. NBH48]|uniref:4-hydroxythreonine-4-phosphate dehydrogenase PdxA n=1 Tax=Paracoccus sp. NBH48 TaxID=2596918 RepID=UPI0019D5D676|nr:4-hydroxythreonine-4-phosphate dehydrogenase PdxA [Paracoccus sp. NBH48]